MWDFGVPNASRWKSIFQVCCVSLHIGLLKSKNLMMPMMVRFFFFIIISDSSNRIRCQMIPPRIMHLTVVQGIDFVISGINYTFLVFVN